MEEMVTLFSSPANFKTGLDMQEKMKEELQKAMFEVEQALGMYATGYCTIPAEAIYDKEALASVMSTIESCHI